VRLAILALEPVAGWGGSEELWADVARAALGARHSVTFTPRHDPGRSDTVIHELKQSGATIIERQSNIDSNGTVHAETIPAAFEVAAQDADMTFISVGGSVRDLIRPEVVVMAERLSSPVVATIQLTRETDLLTDEQRQVGRALFRSLAAVVVPAHRSIAVLERAIAAKLDHALVIQSPIRADLPGALPWPDLDVPTFACVARLSPIQKGQDLLLEVLSDPRWKQREWRLNLVGRGLADRYLLELVALYGLTGRVTLTGFQSDMRAVWERNHLLVLPSREESMPIAIMEAMHCARPCLVTDVGDNALMIDDGFNGFVAEGDRPRALSAALDRAWDARDQWSLMGHRAQATFTSHRDPHPGQTALALLEILSAGRSGSH
jgi:glycosyltransferase involved in cell wall biosynthesis